MFRRLCIWSLAGSLFCGIVALVTMTTPRQAHAASKEIQELQRDLAQLQDQVKQLQQAQDRQLAEIRTLVQQSLTVGNDASKSVAVIQNGLQQSLRDLQEKVVTPVVGVGSRVDQVSSDVRTLQAAVGDLTNMISKIQAQLEKAKQRRQAAEAQAKAKVEILKTKAAALKTKVMEKHN